MPAPTGTNFPGGLDTSTNIGSSVVSSEVIASAYANTQSSAILAIESSIGPNPGGKDWKQHVRAATTAALPANTYVGGSTQTLTANANGALASTSTDGVSLNVGDRLLVKNESTGSNDGIYTVTNLGSGGSKWVLTRAADFNGTSPPTPTMNVMVSEGTVNQNTLWTLTNAAPITLDTTALTFSEFSGGGAGGASYAVDTGSANSYVIAPTPAIIAYTAGQQFVFKAGNANTGASTLKVSGLSGTPPSITKFGSTPVAAGDIASGQIVSVVYDGLQFQMLDPGLVPVANGGTGATTASGARTNLGAAASGANSDITSLSGLTTALSVAQGGTGATTASAARADLGAAASGANSDITSLSGLTTALSVAQGGTGATTASGARTNLGIAPTLYQANGDGSTTTFNIGFTPNFPSAILVHVGGLLQRLTTDYTFSGSTVTFGSAPPSGTNNVQVWGM